MGWKKICATDDIPENSLKQFNVDGVDLMIANYGEGFKAFPPRCPHMEEPLCDSGLVFDGLLTCSKHLWQWDMKTGNMQGMSEKELLFYNIKVEGGDLLGDIDQELEYEEDDEDDEDDEVDFFSAD